MKIRCPKCDHEWESKSQLGFIICASCGYKIKRFSKSKNLNGGKNGGNSFKERSQA